MLLSSDRRVVTGAMHFAKLCIGDQAAALSIVDVLGEQERME
jgi:hypothetical protein